MTPPKARPFLKSYFTATPLHPPRPTAQLPVKTHGDLSAPTKFSGRSSALSLLDRVAGLQSISQATYRGWATNWRSKFISELELPTTQGSSLGQQAHWTLPQWACPGMGLGAWWPRKLTPSNFNWIVLAVSTVTMHSEALPCSVERDGGGDSLGGLTSRQKSLPHPCISLGSQLLHKATIVLYLRLYVGLYPLRYVTLLCQL